MTLPILKICRSSLSEVLVLIELSVCIHDKVVECSFMWSMRPSNFFANSSMGKLKLLYILTRAHTRAFCQNLPNVNGQGGPHGESHYSKRTCQTRCVRTEIFRLPLTSYPATIQRDRTSWSSISIPSDPSPSIYTHVIVAVESITGISCSEFNFLLSWHIDSGKELVNIYAAETLAVQSFLRSVMLYWQRGRTGKYSADISFDGKEEKNTT